MSDVLQKLKEDHVHISRLMDLFEEQVALVRAGENPDAPLMQDIMGFMSNYSDLIHHPLEDLVFEHVMKIDDSSRDILERLSQDHDELARAAHDLKISVDSLESESLVRRDHLDKLATDYVNLVRGHLKGEEEHAFPLAAKLLDEDEWKRIRREFKVKEHEVFGQALNVHYETLYHSITGTAD